MSRTGRPRVEIDLSLAYKLGLQQCTLSECSAWLGVPVSTLSTRPDFSEAYKKGREKGKMSLRRYQWELAKTNPTMAIFLGKQYLGQADQMTNGEDDSETARALNRLASLMSKAQSKYDKKETQDDVPADLGDDAGATSSLASVGQGVGAGNSVPLPVKKQKPAKDKAASVKEGRSK